MAGREATARRPNLEDTDGNDPQFGIGRELPRAVEELVDGFSRCEPRGPRANCQ